MSISIIPGKVYVVTGGSGFLGKNLIKRIIEQKGLVRTMSRSEGALMKLKETFKENIEIMLGDVADSMAVEQLFADEFEGVFHLAAFKHVTLAERFSIECISSNIMGSANVLEIATRNGAKFILGVSTDKAAQVSGVYGASKLVMEKMFHQYTLIYPEVQYRIVRYGNVLYSTGSVVCKWKQQLEDGDELTVTDPEATRFFWTVDSAVMLLFTCLDQAKDSQPFVPEMKAMNIGDLLTAMSIKYSNVLSPTINVIGLQPGENLHERILEDGPYSDMVELYTVDEILEMI